mmetsp:Transcript_30037/g.52737  ORF Transcript_30037/g.52737 Transcript_30037/m.52737 type:complete len:403 (-) Transcript_30037:361-1569(-)|eukprot:CAMPEP_0197539902 /NCGR_PEP_ID=MMETSP1318-20131121/64168_1 /TAXON_ID=552666 /ORGANISM="Partenskyella glossopodia, Strain RCC365" /LENGTH=402 /DNA_ID=CAMNT_0043098743 /DNA_START=161 /DNA_END=1369 /DNA_ORIENTATION=+
MRLARRLEYQLHAPLTLLLLLACKPVALEAAPRILRSRPAVAAQPMAVRSRLGSGARAYLAGQAVSVSSHLESNQDTHDINKRGAQQQQQTRHPQIKPVYKPKQDMSSTMKASRQVALSYQKQHASARRALHVLDKRPADSSGSITSLASKAKHLKPLLSMASRVAVAAIAIALGPGGLMAAHAASPDVAASGVVSGGFLQALSLVFASEIGDKTFFIAALLAMRSSRILAFGGSMLALASMTVISVLIGQIFHNVPASLTGGLPLDDYAAIAFLGYFGVKSLIDAYNLPDDSAGVDDELEEAEKDVANTKAETNWQLIIEAFTLVFTAELGDRSFLATIALSAAQNPVMVGAGAIIAHSLATGIAVASGAILAKYISEKVVGYIGGALFLVFAITTAVGVF